MQRGSPMVSIREYISHPEQEWQDIWKSISKRRRSPRNCWDFEDRRWKPSILINSRLKSYSQGLDLTQKWTKFMCQEATWLEGLMSNLLPYRPGARSTRKILAVYGMINDSKEELLESFIHGKSMRWSQKRLFKINNFWPCRNEAITSGLNTRSISVLSHYGICIGEVASSTEKPEVRRKTFSELMKSIELREPRLHGNCYHFLSTISPYATLMKQLSQ